MHPCESTCVFVFMCMCVRACSCACVCLRLCVWVRVCVQTRTQAHTHATTHARTLVSQTRLIFPRIRMRVRRLAEGGKEENVWVDLPGFPGSIYRF